MSQQTKAPEIGDTHYSWTGTEWIACTIYQFSKSKKGFYASNMERGYGAFQAIPVDEFRPEPTHEVLKKSPKPTPLFG